MSSLSGNTKQDDHFANRISMLIASHSGPRLAFVNFAFSIGAYDSVLLDPTALTKAVVETLAKPNSCMNIKTEEEVKTHMQLFSKNTRKRAMQEDDTPDIDWTAGDIQHVKKQRTQVETEKEEDAEEEKKEEEDEEKEEKEIGRAHV